MNYYETLCIVHPALEAGRLKDIVLNIEELLKANGGTPVSIEVWGKKKLAYFIDKQKYGTYVLIQFTSDGVGNNKFNVELEHNPNVLAYMITRIEKDDLREQTENLDAQIAGKEAKTSRAPREEVTPEKSAETTVEAAEKSTTPVADTEEVVETIAEETKKTDADAPVEESADESEGESKEEDAETVEAASKEKTAEAADEEKVEE